MSSYLIAEGASASNTSRPDPLDDRIFVSLHQNRRIRVFLRDILFVEARRSYCRLVTATGDHLLSISMAAFHRQLPGEVLHQVHRSFLVNLGWVNEVDTASVTIGSHTIPVSASARKLVFRLLHIIQ